MLNALTIDIEDYFNASVFDPVIDRKDWTGLESRVEKNTERILSLLDEKGIKATFFILGWVAATHPHIVREINSQGHEIGSHGYYHQLIYSISKEHFREDIRRSKKILEDLINHQVLAFRAPTYSITKRSMWAIDILIEEGFLYDSSIFPIRHDRYGVPEAPRFPYIIKSTAGQIIEFPPSTARLFNKNFPVSGGAYLRILPYIYTKWGIKKINSEEKKPALIYFHPWELDKEQPRINLTALSQFRHYTNLDKMGNKIERLLTDFEFATVTEVLNSSKPDRTIELKNGN